MSEELKPNELIDNLRACGPQTLSVILHYLAERAHQARLSNGCRITDATDVPVWLHELGDAAQIRDRFMDSPGCARPVRAMDDRGRLDDTCPRCGHIHQGGQECGEQIGGGRSCRCEFEGVPA